MWVLANFYKLRAVEIEMNLKQIEWFLWSSVLISDLCFQFMNFQVSNQRFIRSNCTGDTICVFANV